MFVCAPDIPPPPQPQPLPLTHYNAYVAVTQGRSNIQEGGVRVCVSVCERVSERGEREGKREKRERERLIKKFGILLCHIDKHGA